MDRVEYLNKVQFYKNAIDVYSGPDPLKPRYEYIMWLENYVGKENSDANTCLEQTLNKFQSNPLYTNDTRFVELLVLFSRLKGDKVSYFQKLYESKLGAKCSILYKAWSDELLTHSKYFEAYKVIQKGIHNNAHPLEDLKKADRDIKEFVGQQVLLGTPSCELLKIHCTCISSSKVREIMIVPEVKHWEYNPLKPGEEDNFTCPRVVPNPVDPSKVSMYAKHMFYHESGEYQLEEIKAQKYFEKLKAKNKKEPSPMSMDCLTPSCSRPIIQPPVFKDQQMSGNTSCGDNLQSEAQSFTTHTRSALNLVQGMWESPGAGISSGLPSESFKVPEVPKVNTPFIPVYNDSIVRDDENSGAIRGCSTGQKGLSERKVRVDHRLGDGLIEKVPVKHQLKFDGRNMGQSLEGRRDEDCLAMRLEAPNSPPCANKFQAPSDWNLEDVTCTTKVFNNYVGISSTPNMKGKENVNNPSAENKIKNSSTYSKSDNSGLSTILEASKETPSSSSSNNENKPINTSEVEKSLESLEINPSNPFCPKLQEALLLRINYPYNFEPSVMQHYHVFNSKLPNLTKTLKLGDHVYSLTGESCKGAYAKVLKVINNDKNLALKIEKPACHWEYYICEEIRKRLNTDQVKYFVQVKTAYFFQNGSVLISEWAKYGTLLNVINTNKVKCKTLDTVVGLFLCIEVLSAIHYLNTKCHIIHGDVKPDNFIVHSLPYVSPVGPYVQLIDFGRSIDMNLMPNGYKSSYGVTTAGFICTEMKENRPWTYQTDLFGLAGTMYCILVGDYMKVIKKNDVNILSRPVGRTYQALWNPIFNALLNIESCETLPDLNEFKIVLEENYKSYDPFTIRNTFLSFVNVLDGN